MFFAAIFQLLSFYVQECSQSLSYLLDIFACTS
nr:MAG TPA: protein of unknown function (UPF0239) [Caudoviricetes sp.]DAS16474.1 MAG TPA: protein of unknown function (UPF0239) [Caudoviricetes sp.]DAS55100.1 MAG TPA: protein of unknown function (UPF0239) [Caudoviricetes sp.]